jgi:hypothetical protein
VVSANVTLEPSMGASCLTGALRGGVRPVFDRSTRALLGTGSHYRGPALAISRAAAPEVASPGGPALWC